jgi:hypothetical protein
VQYLRTRQRCQRGTRGVRTHANTNTHTHTQTHTHGAPHAITHCHRRYLIISCSYLSTSSRQDALVCYFLLAQASNPVYHASPPARRTPSAASHLCRQRPRRRGLRGTDFRPADLCPGGGGGATGCSTRRAGPRRAVLPSSTLRSPSLLAGRLLLASVGAPACTATEARPFLSFAERTDWPGALLASIDCPVNPAGSC